jgi:4,5-DOPA dioxygenase extradiol
MSFAVDGKHKTAVSLPAVFVSHRAPTLAVEQSDTVEFLKRPGAKLDGALEELLDYRRLAPHAAVAHPTDEHLLPLFVALGAGSLEPEARGRSLHRGWTWGSLSMAAYSFGSGV